MGYYLDWYRRLVCEAECHRHGEAGELDCILMTLAHMRAEEAAGRHLTRSSLATVHPRALKKR
jgi:hypothetical protein